MAAIIASFIFLFCFSPAKAVPESNGAEQNSLLSTYIVSLKKPEAGQLSDSPFDLERWYRSYLQEVTTSSLNKEHRMAYSYRNVFTGFAAKLTAEEVKAMETMEGFVSARVEKILPLQTTESPNFLGLHQNFGFWEESNLGKGIIIGVLDTGIAPGHPSFSDEGMLPPPSKWRGKCEFNGTVCNNKLIGARNFLTLTRNASTRGGPPFDVEGHGTHTSSTAGGNFVKGANVFGQATGTAVGMAPLAHLAMYKVCGEYGCAESDMLAAMDTAIDDGVDVLSISIGGRSNPFYDDSIAVGAFTAIQKGIFVSCSAGNDGPDNNSLSNEAPWILTVGASTINRSIVGLVELGNGVVYEGQSLFDQKNFTATGLPLVYLGANGSNPAVFCAPGSLGNSDVKGKIVLCEKGGQVGRVQKGQEVKDSGGVGMILMNDKPSAYFTMVDAHVLPEVHVSYEAGLEIKRYINTTSIPMATIMYKGTVIGKKSAPEVASFSSRGPNMASPGILKPDIIGPGVGIIAAWPFSLESNMSTKSTFNIVSGTSMSCPHLSGIAALIKSSHPDWSPAAIKSAIMTTADIMNLEGKKIIDERLLPANIYAVGAGHVNPPSANDPGLIYDIEPADYIPYLCGLNYSDEQVETIVKRSVKCSNVSIIAEAELNYPSFSVVLHSNTSKTYSRTITYVGKGESTFNLRIVAPEGLTVIVKPDEIGFSKANQKAKYTVTFTKPGTTRIGFAQGYLYWVSNQHTVRSPFVVIFK